MTFAFLIPLGIKDPARDWGVPSTKDLGQLVITREDNECLFRSIPEMIARADACSAFSRARKPARTTSLELP